MTDPISHVNVVELPDRLVVTWRGGSPDISVFVSADPDDAGVDVHAPEAPGRATLARPAIGRPYVHLFDPTEGFVVAAPRRVELDGPSNFRDLGGYRTLDGGWTRWGRVFRSDGLHELSDDDTATLVDLGVEVVFDLRSPAEVEAAPDRVPDGVEHVHLPLSSDVAQGRSMLERILDGDLPKFDEHDMAAGYLRMLAGFPEYLRRMVEAVAAGRTIVVHCTAGKDRTGITAMLLLSIAGVAEPLILDDYELSAVYRRGAAEGTTWFADQIRSAGYDPAGFEAMWGSPRPAMRMTLEGMRARWGDHLGYLRAIGVEERTTERARAVLRGDAPSPG